MNSGKSIFILVCQFCALSCADQGGVGTRTASVGSDEELVELITRAEPFGSYGLFPDADTIAAGTLNGSNAHQPQVRVSMNSIALAALRAGRLPAGGAFPDGSIIVKEVLTQQELTLLAVLVKDRANPLAGSGWLWAEFRPDGTPLYSVLNRGDGCVGCHAREEGLIHDHVRTFERQFR